MQVVISDANCLIQLARVELLPLLKQLYGNVVTTPIIAAEFGRPLPPWLHIVTPEPMTRPFALALDAGEASALTLAQLYGTVLLLTDDKAARKVGLMLGLEVRGTLGVLLAAKRAGFLAALAPVFARLRQEGMYLTDDLIADVLRDAGE